MQNTPQYASKPTVVDTDLVNSFEPSTFNRVKSTWLELWNNYLRIKVGVYYGWSTLPNTGLIPLDTILYERSNIYRCIISYTKGASFQADFTSANNWMLVSEGKRISSITATASVSLED